MSDETHVSERPATFREVFAVREYRSVYLALVLTWAGDYIAKAAVTMLVYQESRSVALSATAFATSYLPWLVGGPLLTALADRYPYRTVMVVCDLVRTPLFLLIAIADLPVWLIISLLFLSTLATAPSQAARSAMLPLILQGDRLVVALSLHGSTNQAAQVCGYVVGAWIALYSPRLALLLTAAAFGLSALLIWFRVHHRPAVSHGRRRHLLRETGDGFRLVFGTTVLRAIAILVFASMLFSIVPEGLAAAWATELARDGENPGPIQGLIMAASPVGFILGGLAIGRGVRPSRRQALIRPFAVLAPLALVPAVLNPPAPVVALLTAISGFAVAGLMPVCNGLFVQALPDGYRARAFGVMNTGVQVMQGVAVLATGMLADRFPLPGVVGLWCLAGVLLMLLLATRWPQPELFQEAITRARQATATAPPTTPPARTGGQPVGEQSRPPTPEAGVSPV